MTEHLVITLILAWIIMAASVAAWLTVSRGPGWLRSLGIVALGASIWWQYTGMQQLGGWPTTDELPERFLFHSAVIAEPDPRRGNSGQIDLWVTALVDDRADGTPRAYRLAYSASGHKAVQAAQQRMRNGQAQMGRRLVETDDRTPSQAPFANTATPFALDDLPTPGLPEK